MDEIGRDGLLRHTVPTGMVMRVFLVAIGAFILIVSARELLRGVWPPNVFSLPFLLILVGALAVGIPVLLVGLLGPSLYWTVGPSRIDIESHNPFVRRHHTFTPASVAGFALHEYDGDGGPSHWSVVMITSAGKRFETRVFGTRKAAERLRLQMEAAFNA
jgi:hypothetical protein